jgi:hypothetical protein
MKAVTVKTATLASGLALPYAETGDPGNTPVVFIHDGRPKSGSVRHATRSRSTAGMIGRPRLGR